MIDHEKAYALIEPFEGTVPWMYLDTEGYVTCGIGNLLATPQVALPLPWIWRRDKTSLNQGRAEPDEVDISDEWARVHGAVKGMAAGAYRPLTTMVLPQSEIMRLFGKRVDEFETSLQKQLPEFSAWPEPAQLAVLDMAFNLGVGAFTPGHRKCWPKLTAALQRQDWPAAIVHCHRPQSRVARNERTKELFREAWAQAGVVPERPIT